MDPGPLPLEDGRRLRDPSLLVERAIAREVVAVAGLAAHRAQPRGDPLQCDPGVGDDAEAERAGDAEVSRVDVDLDQALAGGVPPVLVVGHVEIPHARADDEQDVGLAAHLVAGRSEPEDVVRVIGRHRRAARHRRQDRASEQLDDLQQRVVRARAVHSGARDDDRSLRGCEQLQPLVQLRVGGLGTAAAVGSPAG